MKYEVLFPSSSIEKRVEKFIIKIPEKAIQIHIVEAIKSLAVDPRPYGRKVFKILKPPLYFYQFLAQFRLRVGDYRILYDIDDKAKIVWILDVRRRSEQTYR